MNQINMYPSGSAQQSAKHLDTGNELCFVDLGDLFRERFNLMLHKGASVIMRCDQLPVVFGNRNELRILCDHLADLILSYPPAGSKLFLYVECDDSTNDSVSFDGDFRNYEINFHSNMAAGDDWQNAHDATLAECSRIVSAHNGSFIHKKHEHSGCIFSIILSGKN